MRRDAAVAYESTLRKATNYMKPIWIVDDDASIRWVLEKALARENLETRSFANARDAMAAFEHDTPQVLVSDIRMPGESGIDLLQAVKERHPGLPVIIITAFSDLDSAVASFQGGAFDYLAKPFSMLELVARVKALLRRVEAMAQNARIDAGELAVAGLRIDPVARTTQVEGRALELTPREFDLLYFFARHPGQVYSRMDLLNQVWGYQHDGYEHTVNTHINRLRNKIERDPASPQRIQTVWGRGYKLVDGNEGAAA